MVPTELDMSTFEELKQMSGSDFIDELVDTFLEDAPKLLAELRSSLAARDAESFRRAAHSLKSNAATFGANHLSALAKELELLGKEGKLDEAGDQLKTMEATYQLVARELRGLRI